MNMSVPSNRDFILSFFPSTTIPVPLFRLSPLFFLLMSTSSNSPEDELVDDYGEEAAVAAVPTSSSQVSPPSGLPISTIACLTHDELMHNAVFVNYVSLVNMLLVKTHSNPRKMTTPLAYPRPAIHPAHYVFEVLWTMADCLLTWMLTSCPLTGPALPCGIVFTTPTAA